jgi:hypothetical protein
MNRGRALYLDRHATSVRIEGRSFRIGVAGKADARVPFRLISRAVVRNAAAWDGPTIAGCLQAGIPITFLSGDGTVMGLCIGRGHRSPTLADLLDRLVERPDAADIVATWSRAIESFAITEVRRRAGLDPVSDWARQGSVDVAFGVLAGGSTVLERQTYRRLEGLLHGHVVALLGEAGVPSALAIGEAGGVALRQPFVNALRWHLMAAVGRHVAYRRLHPRHRRDPPAEEFRRIVARYEEIAPKIEARLRFGLRRLEAVMREIVS